MQKLTKSKKYISNDDFSTGIGEVQVTIQTQSELLLESTVKKWKCTKYKTELQLYSSYLTDTALLPDLQSELHSELALKPVQMVNHSVHHERHYTKKRSPFKPVMKHKIQ